MKRKFLLIFTLAFLLISGYLGFAQKDNKVSKAEKFDKQKKYLRELELVNKDLQKTDKQLKLLNKKTTILLKLNRYKDALKSSIKYYNLVERKSPWRCMDIVSIALKSKDNETAFKWLETAVKQGLLSYGVLYEEEFSPLKKDTRFNRIIKSIKASIGIGKPAKDFTSHLVSGGSITLSKLKGKVILLDFWAVWCPPCVKGIPHLKKIYNEFKNKNFEIIGISLDKKREQVEKYIAANQIKWKMIHSGKEWYDDIARLYKVNLIPSYWVIDKNGILRDFGIHLRDKEKLKKIIKKIL